MKSANTTIMDYEIMRMFKKGQFKLWTDLYQITEQEFIHYLFDLAS